MTRHLSRGLAAALQRLRRGHPRRNGPAEQHSGGPASGCCSPGGRVLDQFRRLGQRDIPIAGELATSSRRARRRQRARRGGLRRLRLASRSRRERTSTAFETGGRECGGSVGRLHAFRHTAPTLLFAAGANFVVVQRFLGHHLAAFTLDTYVHLFEERRGQALDLSAVVGT